MKPGFIVYIGYIKYAHSPCDLGTGCKRQPRNTRHSKERKKVKSKHRYHLHRHAGLGNNTTEISPYSHNRERGWDGKTRVGI